MDRSTFFKFAALLTLGVAVYHVVAIFYPLDTSPPWRHAIFIIVSLFCSYGLIKRPKYFVYFFGVLSVQQFYSHGTDFLNKWSDHHKVDWISLGVLIFIPIILYNLIVDARGNKNA